MIRRMDVRRTFVVPVVAVLLLGSGYLSTAVSARIAATRPAIQQHGSLALPNCSPAESGEQVQPMPTVAHSLAPPDTFGAVGDLLATAFVAEVPPGPLLVVHSIEMARWLSRPIRFVRCWRTVQAMTSASTSLGSA
jgi:hypothetical protein